jgi:hypothetical protein
MNIRHVLAPALVGGLFLLALTPPGAEAALVYENINGSDFVYDPAQDITWTRDANISGQTFTWQQAQDWAAGLSFPGVATLGWHLPSADQFTSLYTQLEPFGGPGSTSDKYGPQVLFGGGADDFAIHVSPIYWTGTDAINFNFYYGYAGSASNPSYPPPYSAWAVATVPSPSTLGLIVSGLAGLGVFGKRRAAPG